MVDHDSTVSLNYYLIPGMGADRRLFQHFDLKYGQIHYLDWIPHGDSKNLTDYAGLMSQRITTENNIIIGSSMGGMTAVEMSRLVKPLTTILVSAPTGRHEFPRILKLLIN
jgi:pimeloyl-ACP methyl ester carboxylesterase